MKTNRKPIQRMKRRGSAPIEFMMVLPLFIALLVTIVFVVRSGINKLESATTNRTTTWLQRYAKATKAAQNDVYPFDKISFASGNNSGNNSCITASNKGKSGPAFRNVFSEIDLKILSASAAFSENSTDTTFDENAENPKLLNDKQAVYDDAWNYLLAQRTLHRLLLAGDSDCVENYYAKLDYYQKRANELPWEIAKSFGNLLGKIALLQISLAGDQAILLGKIAAIPLAIGLTTLGVPAESAAVGVGFLATLLIVEALQLTQDVANVQPTLKDANSIAGDLSSLYSDSGDLLKKLNIANLPGLDKMSFVSLATGLIDLLTTNPLENTFQAFDLLTGSWKSFQSYLSEYEDVKNRLEELKNQEPCP